MEGAWRFWAGRGVARKVKIPEPMTAPIPREVRLNHPSDFFNRRSGSSASEISWSMFLTRNSPEPTRHHPTAARIEQRGDSTLTGFTPQLRARDDGGAFASSKAAKTKRANRNEL